MHWPLQRSVVLALILSGTPARVLGQSGNPPDMSTAFRQLLATVQDLRNEVAELRRTVARLEFARHRDNMQQLRSELSGIQAEHARLAELDRSRQQDLRDMEELLERSDSPNRLELETTRSELAVRREREIAEQTDAARVREADLVRRLRTEEQIAKRLEETWKFTKGDTQ
jgi:hypothetical protein